MPKTMTPTLSTARNAEQSFTETETKTKGIIVSANLTNQRQVLFLTGFRLLLAFDLFPSIFLIVFVIVFALAILSAILNFYRNLRKPSQQLSEQSGPTVVKEREIIREVIKIRCPYCSNLYDEKYDKCPYCGGKRTP